MNIKKRQRFDDLVLALVENPSASLKELAEAADIGKTTLYRLGGARDSLVEKAIDYAMGKINTLLEEFVFDFDNPKAVLMKLAQRSLEQDASVLFLVSCRHLRTDRVIELEQRWCQKLDQFFLQGQTKGVFHLQLSSVALTEMWVALLSGLIYSEQRGRLTRAEILSSIDKNFIQSLIKE